MKISQYLLIHLNGFEIESLVELFTNKCAGNWHRALERERDVGALGGKAFSFEHASGYGTMNTGILLFHKEGDTWYVPNNVIYETSIPYCDQDNKLLRDFFEKIVQPSIIELEVTAELTNDQISMKDIIGEDVALILSKFSTMANKSTGSSHPCDINCWFDFISAVQSKRIVLATDLLIWTLVEDGWSEEAARDLGIEFEFAIRLLDYQEGKQSVY